MSVPAIGRKGVAISATMMAAIVATLVGLTPQWEGVDVVARRGVIRTVGTFMKWVIVGLIGILAGFVMIGESISKIAAWLRG